MSISTDKPNEADDRNATNGQFKKGNSGNPAGRPPGSRNRSSLFIEQLLDSAGEELVQKALDLASKGDTAALRLCLERICPPRKERPIDLPLPQITDAQD